MDQCFVIQPFDGNTFDRRYTDIFEKAIKISNLNPYRVDQDPSSRIPIEAIEQNIKDSRVCFAEITSNNPNVWYELGYAFALGKDVVMVCCKDERADQKYPFDIQHRSIIEYQSKSSSDFDKLSEKITTKLNSFLATSELTNFIKESALAPREGLNTQEIAFMLILLENAPTPETRVDSRRVSDQMDKAGFTKAATNLSHRTLARKGMIKITEEENYDYHNTYDTYFTLTDKGENWLIDNEDKILIRYEPTNLRSPVANKDEDQLPF